MKLGWGVSGRGIGARAIVEAHEIGLLTSGISTVVFDRPSPMQSYCDAHAIPYMVRTAECFDNGFVLAREQYSLNWLGLTFNRLIAQSTINAFAGKIFNLHMSLLPSFPGIGATRRALQSGNRDTGVTIHLVDVGMDTGPILAQKLCPIEPNDTEATLGRRQFESAVPLLLQAVRNAGSGELLPFSSIDADLALFSREFCSKL